MNGARVIPRKVFLVLAVLLIAALVAFQMLRTLPVVAAASSVPASMTVPGTPPSIPLPAKGEAAVGTAELGIVAASPAQQPLPMASVAKLMTALVLLDDKPLVGADPGPTIVIDSTDVADYQARLAAGESVLKVAAGEQLSEFDALQGLLIPSGNNIASVLAKWDAGSVSAFIAKMTARAALMRLNNSHFDDTAGVSAKSASTPSDLFRIAIAAMKNPTIAKIVGEPQANLPVAGVVYNVDYVLGQDGIIGVKTGSGPDFGANFVFASKQAVGNQAYTIYGAVMGADTLADAFKSTIALIDAVKPVVQVQSYVADGDVVGTYRAPWGAQTNIRAGRAVTYFTWPGMKIKRSLAVAGVMAPVEAGRQVGHMVVSLGEQVIRVPITTASVLPQPGIRWRLTRIS